MVKKLLLILGLLSALPALSNSAMFDQHFNDYSENLSDAQDANKDGVFVFFFMDDCPFCQKMERQVLNQPKVIEYFKKHFLNYKINTESDLELVDFEGNDTVERIFAKRHNRIGATPVLAFFDLKGNRVVRRTGFANQNDFLLLAKYMVEKAYLKEKFVRYKRKHR
ncbi:thioredoxin fold domain-containing protein [Candidatus Thioglobus autotrophicus]|uniref:thioredoxin family protein n=1 Tax=Candidatus Thioglobus autotrophicus TaxID=1705394 RepID=UPI00299DFDA4|nr:thioredoxin fold domain-containing protein [Candidatus Thioglobus autotrophicus]WPE16883.1 thioredoxin fold domain-containing protein [Candidatus Thioglobus autotrophicus]